jgi:hypothetical protein
MGITFCVVICLRLTLSRRRRLCQREVAVLETAGASGFGFNEAADALWAGKHSRLRLAVKRFLCNAMELNGGSCF